MLLNTSVTLHHHYIWLELPNPCPLDKPLSVGLFDYRDTDQRYGSGGGLPLLHD